MQECTAGKTKNRNTRPPQNQGENAGKKHSKGGPTHPEEEEEEAPLGQKNPKKESTK